MAHKLSTAIMALGIAAAASTPALAGPRDIPNSTLESVNQPVVQREDYAIDLATYGGGVPNSELARLADWFGSLGVSYGDQISVDQGGYGDPRVAQDVARVAADYGLLISAGAPMTAGPVQPGTARVVVSRAFASVPGCPNWADAADIGNRITTASNYGCAINSNFASMVANPNDLVLGQTGLAGGDAASANKAIKAYRERPPTGQNGQLKTEATGGK
jgi:pilus assembly protein CpaD